MAHDELSTEKSWSTNKSYHEAVELMPHVRALDFSRVWLRDGALPLELVENVRPSSVRYEDLIAGVVLSSSIKDPSGRFPDVEFACCVDLIDHRGAKALGFNWDGVSSLIKNLPEAPRSQLRRILRDWGRKFNNEAKRAKENFTQTEAIRDRMHRFLGEIED